MNNKRRIPHALLKKELLASPDVLKAYLELDEEYQLIHEMLTMRESKKVTQKEMAKRMHTTASVVSRLESMTDDKKPSPSLRTLKRYAHALGCRLYIKLVPKLS
jgi:DNA-binding transcriptional regulator YiaG